MDDYILFAGKPIKCLYDSEGYKIYAMDVNRKEYPCVCSNKYGNVTITGDIPALSLNINYKITAILEKGKYGDSYSVSSIKTEIPNNQDTVFFFLKEILTFSQAKALYLKYPNIVQMVVENPSVTIDFNGLKGIKSKTFDKIKDKIIENYLLIDIIEEYHGMINLTTLKKMFNEYRSVETIKRKIKEDPYECLCHLNGIGFKLADETLIKMQREGYDFGYDLIPSKQRCESYIQYQLKEHENNGDTYLNLNSIIAKAETEIPECRQVLFKAIKSKKFMLNKDKMCISNRNTYETEQFISKCVTQLLTNKLSPIDVNLRKYKKINDIELTDKQTNAIKGIAENQLFILTGNAGCGKTQTTKSIVSMLDDCNINYCLMAPTGKAAKVLGYNTDRVATTIHRGLGYRPPSWLYNSDNKLPYDVIIVDEFSMVDIWLFKRLLEAIDLEKTRLLLIGDDAQLPSVSCGNILYDLLSFDNIKKVKLDKVFRFQEGGLMNVATKIRNTEDYLPESTSKITKFGERKDYIFIQSNDGTIQSDVLQIYMKALEENKVEDIQVLTAYKKGKTGTIELNKSLQKIANKNYGSNICLRTGDTTYYIDDIVIQNINNYKAIIKNDSGYEETCMIANGETGKIIDIDESKHVIVIDFDGVCVVYGSNDFASISLGYAISIHKSQGSSSKIIILSTPKAQSFMLNSNLIYVGVTRTQNVCYHLGEYTTINKAIHKKENFERKTLLNYFLNNELLS